MYLTIVLALLTIPVALLVMALVGGAIGCSTDALRRAWCDTGKTDYHV